jgi:tetratricopeptide (TPR) repeat protein
MPRWLSEGISVYEERQRDPAWGQGMTPAYRQMILDGQLTPVSQLSGAFLRPPSPQHLQFAYYESSLVVEYLIQQFGLETLCRVLTDLGDGLPIDVALARYTGSAEGLDRSFADFARQHAEQFAAQLDWDRSVLPETSEVVPAQELLQEHPRNYWLLMEAAQQAVERRQWDAARNLLEQIHSVFPQDTSSDGSCRLLARVCRELQDTTAERAVLETLASHDSSALDAYRRLGELAVERADWPAVRKYAQQTIAVNPMNTAAQEQLATAALQLEDSQSLIDSQLALLENEPVDPALVHYRLATAYRNRGESQAAKRHVLMALEEAPRFRDAQRLLLELVDSQE